MVIVGRLEPIWIYRLRIIPIITRGMLKLHERIYEYLERFMPEILMTLHVAIREGGQNKHCSVKVQKPEDLFNLCGPNRESLVSPKKATLTLTNLATDVVRLGVSQVSCRKKTLDRYWRGTVYKRSVFLLSS